MFAQHRFQLVRQTSTTLLVVLRDTCRQHNTTIVDIHHIRLQTTNLRGSYERGMHQLADDKVLRVGLLKVLPYLLAPFLGYQDTCLRLLALRLDFGERIDIAIALLNSPIKQDSTLFNTIVVSAITYRAVIVS